ncbi:filamentous hemagglutinin family protein [Pseudomonas aeruginosa]|uniref:filamentous hemagglutinin family protein n=1 Tax=Pseudomonas aeruginosa TaxID=287 RepID=UPI000FF5DD39|nr:filamentous hemagglutinin family protein [Pseudomonas aeruginosa]MBO3770178.1 filamentous hemagglutinin family protein [Pseudomonas aeruginosa]MCD2812017.1 filamentous hemagglutinin family protein [Pseudomonas aeruginosa]MCH0752618.1 filamentous hemagglutinin family protein [Pseudomonas aeruginosa]RWX86084.1 filamentous hemagglutinin N-terminal domain-containing protein [Pseudomonas aeruginosa]HCF6144765.1 filamentous hemagglutinin family protein [Pseudomonas aeruginosa]
MPSRSPSSARSSRALCAPRLKPLAQAIALLLVAGGAQAAGQPFSAAWFAAKGAAQGGATGAPRPGAQLPGAPPPLAQQQRVNQQLQRSMANLNNTVAAIAAQQAAQAAGRQAALNLPQDVPDGLGEGGLKVDASLPFEQAWQNAKGPVQTQAGGKTTVSIEQTADKAVLNWETFNVGRNTTVDFQQHADWALLNRVNDPSARPSQIQGQIKADGTVMLVNRNGVVFSGSSQVDVRNLTVAAANISDEQFRQRGLYYDNAGSRPTFTDAAGAVRVEQGAQLRTAAPSGSTKGGGYVLLLGSEVDNAGSIVTPKGQTVLSAGDSFVIRRGQGTDGNLTSTTRGNEVLPGFAADSSAGRVRNSGLVQAATGDISLSGREVEQAGVLLSSSSVDSRGTLHLKASERITLAEGATSAILVDSSGSAALDSQREALLKPLNGSSAAVSRGDDDRRDLSRVEIDSAGSVDFRDGSITLASGGQVAVNAGQRALLRDGAVIDVSGAQGVQVAMETNSIKVNVRGNEQRDASVNREGGGLNSQDVWVDVRDLVRVPAGTNGYASDRWYTAGGLLEVGGYLGTQGHSAGEWMAQGGIVSFTGNDVVTQAGSQINLSGGTLDVQGGYIRQTWLKGSDGRLYELGSAPGDLLYDGIYRGYEAHSERWDQTRYFYNPLIAPTQRYENGYIVGRDAGSLVIGSANARLDGQVVGDTYRGERQTEAPQAGLDGYNQSQNAVARGAQLVVGRYTPYYVKSSGLLEYALGADAGSLKQVVIGAGEVAAEEPTLDAPVAAERQGRLSLDSELLNGFQLGGLKVAAGESIRVDGALTLANGGEAILFANDVAIDADITAHGGSLQAGNVLAQISPNGTIDGFVDSGREDGILRVGDGVRLDASGLWSNLLLAPEDNDTLAYRDGGRISLRSGGDLSLGQGSLLDVSSGAALLADGKRLGGRGGDIALHASAGPALAGDGQLQLGGTLSGLGVSGAGTLSLQSGKVRIGGGDLGDGSLQLAEDFFQQGFASYRVVGRSGLTVAEDAQVRVARPVYRFASGAGEVAAGEAPREALEAWTPPLYLEDALAGRLIQREGADLYLQAGGDGNILAQLDPASQTLELGRGSLVEVDPGRAIVLRGPGQITLDGTLNAWGGRIDVRQQQFGQIDVAESFQIAQAQAHARSIWIGEQAVLDVAGRATTALDWRGRTYGEVQSGGSIVIGGEIDPTRATATSADAFVIVRPGARLEASGSQALLDVPGQGRTLVAGDGGRIALSSYNGLFLDGALRAAAGGHGAAGGSLELALESPLYRVSELQGAGVLAWRELQVAQQMEEPLGSELSPGQADTALRYGQGRLAVEQVEAGGFDRLSLLSNGGISFAGDVSLALGQSLNLYSGSLSLALGAADDTAVSLRAPYVHLSGLGSYYAVSGMRRPQILHSQLPETALSRARLQIAASGLLEQAGSLSLGMRGDIPGQSEYYQRLGFEQAILSSQGDLRFLGAVSDGDSRGRLWTRGGLELLAAQLYPSSGVVAEVRAGVVSDPGRSERFDEAYGLRIGRTTSTSSAMPYSVFGALELFASDVQQGGVIRAPLGRIELGNGLSGAESRQVELLPGSLTSVSGTGLVMPYGGTTDGVSYRYDGKDIGLAGAGGVSGTGLTTGITLNGQRVKVDDGARLDLSGGGELTGAGFISGRGGSTDARFHPLVQIDAEGRFHLPELGDNPVYAILPGVQPGYAPQGGEAGAVAPLAGQQVTLTLGVPGLPAGTYTLLPSTYALLPGAFRVELNGRGTPVATQALRNGSWSSAGYLSVGGTAIRDSLASQVILSSADTLRRYSQYNETSYADFVRADAARLGVPRAMLPADARSLLLNLARSEDAQVGFHFAGEASFKAAKDGYGGSLILSNLNGYEVLAAGTQPTSGFNGASVYADDLVALDASRLVIGGVPAVQYGQTGNLVNFTGPNGAVAVRSGARLSAAEVLLLGNVEVEAGAAIDTRGRGEGAFDSSDGYVYQSGDRGLLALSNGWLNILAPAAGNTAQISIGECTLSVCAPVELYSEGTLGIATNGSVQLDDNVRYGTRNLSLALSAINIGSSQSLADAAARGVLPNGLVLDQTVLQRLLRGERGAGIPALENLILSARDAVNMYGSVSLDTYDPATGKSSLANLVLGTPAIYGHGTGEDVASIRTASLVWSGSSQPATAPVAGGAGSGSGTLRVDAERITLGYGANTQPAGETDEARLALGFAEVQLNASERISANHKGSLRVYQRLDGYVAGEGLHYSGGDLRLSTPLLTGEAGSLSRISSGGSLSLAAPAGAAAVTFDSGTAGLGAELSLSAREIRLDSAVSLPSGKLSLSAEDDLELGDGARIDLAGRKASFNDVDKYSWGGDLLLSSRAGDIRQAAGSLIDLSARNNRGGTLSAVALAEDAGVVDLQGRILGGASGDYDAGGTRVPFLGGELEIRAQRLGDGGSLSEQFAALNQRLNQGEVFGARRFQLKQGDLQIGDGLKAHRIEVSLDNGQLGVSGTVDASGAQVGEIRLAGGRGLSLGGNALLDAHGSLLRRDSYGQIIDSPNRAMVELSSGSGTLVLAGGARIDLRHGTAAPAEQVDGVARGTLELNAPRLGGVSAGDIAIDASGALDIRGAGSIALNAVQRYDDAPWGNDPAAGGRPYQVIDQAYLDARHAESSAFIAAALANRELLDGKLAGLTNATYADAFHLRPGVEIVSATADGDLVVQGDLDLSGYRYASLNPNTPLTEVYGSGEVGALVLRAGGDLNLYGSINDGFAPPPDSPDDKGWILTPGVQPFGGDLVVPGPGVVLGDGTAFLGGRTLNYDLPIKGTTLAAGTRLATEAVLEQPYTLAAGSVLVADIHDAAGNLLYAAGSLLRDGVILEAGSRLGAGTLLAAPASVQAMIWPAGVPLPSVEASGNTLLLNGELALARGALIPSQTDVVLSGDASSIELRPSDGTRQGRNWALAEMLPAGSQSWSLRLVAGADLSAADNRLVQPDSTASLNLADTHYQVRITEGAGARVFTDEAAVWGVVPGTEVTEVLAWICDLGPEFCASPPKATWAPGNWLGMPEGVAVTDEEFAGICLFFPDQCIINSTTKLEPQNQLFSVLRTGTGDLDLASAGNLTQWSPYGVYTAGTQAVDVGAPFNQPRGQFDGTLLGSNGADYESLAAGQYQAWYPQYGGNLNVSVGGDLAGDVWASSLNNAMSLTRSSASVGNWLWRQGNDDTPVAWWVNFGSYAMVADAELPALLGFTGFGTLGGGDVSMRVGGAAGNLMPRGTDSLPAISEKAFRSQGLIVAVGSNGRVERDGTLTLGGGGDMDIRVGGTLNPDLQARVISVGDKSGSSRLDLQGVLVNLRGTAQFSSGAIGGVGPLYDMFAGQRDPTDTRPYDAFTATRSNASGGLVVIPGDATLRLDTRGDLVLGGSGDPGRVNLPNSSAFSTQEGIQYAGGGVSWFSLWSEHTAIDLFAAGGNLTPSTQVAEYAVNSGLNTSPSDGRFIYPAILRAAAPTGSIYLGPSSSVLQSDHLLNTATSLLLAPSLDGELALLAGESIYAGGYSVQRSGADPASLPSIWSPAFAGYADAGFVDRVAGNGSPDGNPALVEGLPLFYFGADSAAALVRNLQPVRFYALSGDIVGLNSGALIRFSDQAGARAGQIWYEGAGPVWMRAGRDIVASGTPLGRTASQIDMTTSFTGNLFVHDNPNDLSLVQAGRDILYSNFNVAGPGTLEISAGRNILMEDRAAITSLGAVVPGDSRPGADIVLQAGAAGADYQAFLERYLDPANLAQAGTPLAEQPGKVVRTYESELAKWLNERFGFAGDAEQAQAFFAGLPAEQQRIFARQVYFAELRAGGREYNEVGGVRQGSYLRGRNAIAALFPERDPAGNPISYEGDIVMYGGAGVHTDFGGDIQLLSPGGRQVFGIEGEAPPSTAGIVTQGQGDIQAYSRDSILLGQSRIMTTFGGSILAWSAEGDINAGRGSQTTVVYTPPRRIYDAWGNVSLSPQVPSTGAGIATLNPIPEVAPGDIDLIAPLGTIDAGEAGIRVSGNVNVAALQVVNAANIQTQGQSSGIPLVASVNTGALTSASAAASSATQAAEDVSRQQQAAARQRMPSVITVQVLGFGNERLEPSRDGASRSPGYNPDSAVQVLGAGALGEQARSQLTDEERGNLIL